MTSTDFLEHCAQQDSIKKIVFQNPNAKKDVEEFAHRTHIKELLFLLGTKVVELLVKILEQLLIKKYNVQ
jgi:hypothetical protein